jgi:hypothetical protein
MHEVTFQQLKESNFHSPIITDVIFDQEKVIEIITDWVNIADKGFDTLWDANMFNFLWKYGKEGMLHAKKMIEDKGIKIRMITETTNDNFGFIDSLNCPSMRHLGGIRGNFGIFDERAYMLCIFHNHIEKPDQTLWNNSESLVSQQQKIFNKLWELAIPFSSRKYELENNFTNKRVISDHNAMKEEIKYILDQPVKELLIFSSANLFRRLIVSNNIAEILKKLLKRGVKVKILLDNVLREFMHQIYQINSQNPDNDLLQVSYSNKLGNFNEFIIICDQKSVLQINSDAASNLTGSLSNEQHQVILQEVLFEKYWNEVIDITTSK